MALPSRLASTSSASSNSSPPTWTDPKTLSQRIAIIGAGAAGLVTAHTLLQDGFTDVQLFTRDKSVGGTWARERVYPGLKTNNLFGEYSFSSYPMPPPSIPSENRITGFDLRSYFESFADKFLHGHIRFNTEVVSIKRKWNSTSLRVVPGTMGGKRGRKESTEGGGGWLLRVRKDGTMGREEDVEFDKVVLCTGGCSRPSVPRPLSPAIAESIGYEGLVIHSSQFGSHVNQVLQSVGPKGSGLGQDGYAGSVVVIGGGKSAQDIAAYLASEGRQVTLVFEKTDAFLAYSSPLPAFLRRSRFLSVLSPYINLRSKLEEFLHTTWLGSKIVRFIWDQLAATSLAAARVPATSPLRNTHSLFWSIRTNDNGVPGSATTFRFNGGGLETATTSITTVKSFHALVNQGKIDVVAPARVVGYTDRIGEGDGLRFGEGERWGEEGGVVVVADGAGEAGSLPSKAKRKEGDRQVLELRATVVILATGYESSWEDLFDVPTLTELGLARHPLPSTTRAKYEKEWDNYLTLADPPAGPTGSGTMSTEWMSSIYRGVVPARNILKHDFAINGAAFSANFCYTAELSAHWIASYFRSDPFLRLPPSMAAAEEETQRKAVWLRKRFGPGVLNWANESYSSEVTFWSWPQASDELLEDMDLPAWRSSGVNGGWNWAFKVIENKELERLGEERALKRQEWRARGGGASAASK